MEQIARPARKAHCFSLSQVLTHCTVLRKTDSWVSTMCRRSTRHSQCTRITNCKSWREIHVHVTCLSFISDCGRRNVKDACDYTRQISMRYKMNSFKSAVTGMVSHNLETFSQDLGKHPFLMHNSYNTKITYKEEPHRNESSFWSTEKFTIQENPDRNKNISWRTDKTAT